MAAWFRTLNFAGCIFLSIFCFVTQVWSEPGIESNPTPENDGGCNSIKSVMDTGTGMPTEPQFTIQGHPIQVVDIRDKKVDEELRTTVREAYGKLPLYFIRNDGQMDERVKFYERGSGHFMFFTERGIYLSFVRSCQLPVDQRHRHAVLRE